MKSVLPKWRSHCFVHAAQILEIDTHPGRNGAFLVLDGGHSVEVSAAYMGEHRPKPGGYYVLYPDGHEAWFSAQAFERLYGLMVPDVGAPAAEGDDADD